MLQLVACRRSGEHSAASCPWAYVECVARWVMAFLDGASNRWTYRLREDFPTLRALDVQAIQAEIRRQLSRVEEPTKRLLPPDHVVADFEALLRLVLTASSRLATGTSPVAVGGERDLSQVCTARALEDFIVLSQTASFLARGQDS